MKKKKNLDKQQYNRRRRILFCAFAFSTVIVSFIYIVFSVILSLLYGSKGDVISNFVGILSFVYIGLALSTCYHIYSYKHPQYGEFTFADEFRSAKKYKYEGIDIIDFLKNKLVVNSFSSYESTVDFIKGTYYYKQEKKKYYVVLFIEQPITKRIYNDYINNNLYGFIDSLADKGMLEQWKKIYLSIIFKEDRENKYVKKLIDYNLPLPQDIGYLPILVDEEKKQLSISNFDYGLGLTEYEEMKKVLFEVLDKNLINLKSKRN